MGCPLINNNNSQTQIQLISMKYFIYDFFFRFKAGVLEKIETCEKCLLNSSKYVFFQQFIRILNFYYDCTPRDRVFAKNEKETELNLKSTGGPTLGIFHDRFLILSIFI